MADIVLNPDGTIKKDVYDVGAPMRPAVPGVTYQNPEDAHSPAPKRGDYRGRQLPRSGWRRSTTNIFGERVVAGRGGVGHG